MQFFGNRAGGARRSYWQRPVYGNPQSTMPVRSTQPVMGYQPHPGARTYGTPQGFNYVQAEPRFSYQPYQQQDTAYQKQPYDGGASPQLDTARAGYQQQNTALQAEPRFSYQPYQEQKNTALQSKLAMGDGLMRGYGMMGEPSESWYEGDDGNYWNADKTRYVKYGDYNNSLTGDYTNMMYNADGTRYVAPASGGTPPSTNPPAGGTPPSTNPPAGGTPDTGTPNGGTDRSYLINPYAGSGAPMPTRADANAAATAAYNAQYAREQANTQAAADALAAARGSAVKAYAPQLDRMNSTLKANMAERGTLDTSGFSQLTNDANATYQNRLAQMTGGYDDQIQGLWTKLGGFAAGQEDWIQGKAADLYRQDMSDYTAMREQDIQNTQFYSNLGAQDRQYYDNLEQQDKQFWGQLNQQDKQFYAQLAVTDKLTNAQIREIDANITKMANQYKIDLGTLKFNISQAIIAGTLSTKEIMGDVTPEQAADSAKGSKTLVNLLKKLGNVGDPVESFAGKWVSQGYGPQGDARTENLYNLLHNTPTVEQQRNAAEAAAREEANAIQARLAELEAQKFAMEQEQWEYTQANADKLSPSDQLARDKFEWEKKQADGDDWEKIKGILALEATPQQKAALILAQTGMNVWTAARRGDKTAIAVADMLIQGWSSRNLGTGTPAQQTPATSPKPSGIPSWSENYERWMSGDNTAPGNKASWFDEFGYHANPIAGIGSGIQTLWQNIFTPRIVK